MRESLLYFDRPAEAAVELAASYFAAAGLTITQRSAFSVSFSSSAAALTASNTTYAVAGGAGYDNSPLSPAEFEAGSGQVAAVPIQLRPAWCRVWVTVADEGVVAGVAGQFVAAHVARSQALATEVTALERDIYAGDRWPAYEAQLRASLAQRGAGDDEVEAKVAVFRKRWQALGRKAASSREAT